MAATAQASMEVELSSAKAILDVLQTTDPSGVWNMPYTGNGASPPVNTYEHGFWYPASTTKRYSRGAIAPSRFFSADQNDATHVQYDFAPRVVLYDPYATAQPIYSTSVGVGATCATSIEFVTFVHSMSPPPGGYGIATVGGRNHLGMTALSTSQSHLDTPAPGSSSGGIKLVFHPRHFVPRSPSGMISIADLGVVNLYTSSQAWHDNHPVPFAGTIARARTEITLYEPYTIVPLWQDFEGLVPGVRGVKFRFFQGSTPVGDAQVTVPASDGGGLEVGLEFPDTDGTYTVEMTAPSMLKRIYEFEIVDEELVDPITFAGVMGDVDGSGEIDAADIDAVTAVFGLDALSDLWHNSGDPNIPSGWQCDVDGSGEVDSADIDLVLANYGEVSD